MNRLSLIAIFFAACAGALLFSSFTASAERLNRIVPEKAGMSSEMLSRIDSVVNGAVVQKTIPGAVVAVVRDTNLVFIKAYGYKSLVPDKVPMSEDDIFDLASMSKSLGTAICFMQLVERGYVRLSDKVEKYIPGFGAFRTKEGKSFPATIQDLMTHTSGLPSYVNPQTLKDKYGKADRNTLLRYIKEAPRKFAPKTDFLYSCLNFITLQYILEDIMNTTLADYAGENVFLPLGLESTAYVPSGRMLERTVPTEVQPDGLPLCGVVHDPLARIVNGGISGNAGLFSTADDIAVLAAALMNGGSYGGKRILGKLTVGKMTSVPEDVHALGRSLGWDNYSAYSSNNGDIFPYGTTYGHTGYTGTSIVVDPVNKIAVIVLTSRVHPEDKGSVAELRAVVSNIVAGSLEN